MNMNESQTNILGRLTSPVGKEKHIFSLYKHTEAPQEQLNIHYSETIHKRKDCLEDNGLGKILSEMEPEVGDITAMTGADCTNKAESDHPGGLDYFSLPKYGMSESSTQTDLTAGAIADLLFIREEYMKGREEFHKRQFNVLKLGIRDGDLGKANFIGIKRKGDPIKFSTKKVEKVRHVTLKKPRKLVKETAPKAPVNVSNVTETNNYIMFNEFLIDKGAPKILFDEGFNVADMINDIKMNKISMFTEAKRKKVSSFLNSLRRTRKMRTM
jgi:hypothetical protein